MRFNNIANIKPIQVKDINWGWKNVTRDSNTFVSEPLGKIQMPNLIEPFNWQNYTVVTKHEDFRFCELSTQNMKSVFTTAARFLGYEKLLIEQPDLSEITDEFLRWNKRLLEKFADIRYFIIGDDIGTNRGLMISPDNWRRWLKPQLQKLVDLGLNYNCQVIFHSGGDIMDIFFDLSEMGIVGLQYEPVGLMKEFQGMSTFNGLSLIKHDATNDWGNK